MQSITGVDLTLNLAGPGTRSYAFIIDWHIRALLAGAWLLIAVYVFHLSLRMRSSDALLSSLPAAVIYFLYHPIVELAMQGRTPGKRMAKVRILNRLGGQPNTTALLIRNIFRLVDSLPALYVVGLVACIFSEHRVRVGDLAAGTLLVADETESEVALTRAESFAKQSTLPLDVLELTDQILERWDSLLPQNRQDIARSLLARVLPADAAADLSIWSEARLRAQLQAILNP